MLQYNTIMRANGPRALIKSSPLHQCNHEEIRVLRHVPLTPQKLGNTNHNFNDVKQIIVITTRPLDAYEI